MESDTAEHVNGEVGMFGSGGDGIEEDEEIGEDGDETGELEDGEIEMFHQ